MRRAGWCLGVSHRAGAAAQISECVRDLLEAPEGFSTDSRYSEAFEVFQMIEVLGSVLDFPRFEVLVSVQDFKGSGELESARGYP